MWAVSNMHTVTVYSLGWHIFMSTIFCVLMVDAEKQRWGVDECSIAFSFLFEDIEEKTQFVRNTGGSFKSFTVRFSRWDKNVLKPIFKKI